jgi:hypothetical protein
MISLILRRCGDDLTRKNLLDKATHLREAKVPMVQEGCDIYNSPESYLAYHNLQLAQFDGNNWIALKFMPTTN